MKMPKRFKQIPGTEGLYYISRKGEVYSVPRNTSPGGILKPTKSKYYVLALYINGISKTSSIHRLLAITFLPNPHNYNQVNHKDGDKFNNKLSNLEWCSHSWNQKHRFEVLKQVSNNRKLTRQQVFSILSSPHISARQLGFKMKICPDCVRNIRHNRTYADYIAEFKALSDFTTPQPDNKEGGS